MKALEGVTAVASRAAPLRRQQCAALAMLGTGPFARIVLITSRRTRRWVLPKGWVEPGEPGHRGALREAFEEAGLIGEADREPLGTYSYLKRRTAGQLVTVEVRVFRLRVARLLADWPERAERTRRLVRPAAAAAMVAEPELARLLRDLAGAP